MTEQSSEKKVRKRTTSCEVRNRWNAKHYDRINITVPKGYGEMFKEFCDDNGTTMNATLTSIITFELEKWKHDSAKNAEKKEG